MGFFEDDLDDNTIGVPRPVVRKPESRMPIDRPREVPRPQVVAEPIRQAPRLDRGPAAAAEHDEFVGDTIVPPRPSKPRPSSTPPARPREEPPARVWAPSPSPSPSPLNPGWDKLADDFDTAGGPSGKLNGSPSLDGSPIPEQPWTVYPASPPARPAEARVAPEPVDPMTPPAYSKARPAAALPRVAPVDREVSDAPQTMAIEGGGFHFGVPHRLFVIQYLDRLRAQWRELEDVRPGRHVLGRGSFRHETPGTEFLADDHLRIITEGDQLFIERGETINGVFRKLTPHHPVELADGARFLIREHVIEFQAAEPGVPVERRPSRDGEVYWWRPLVPLAYLNFVGPHDGLGVRFPLTRPGGTILGREGDIVLDGDLLATKRHARITGKDGRFVLEDLNSTNGTFIQIVGRSPLRPGNLQRNTEGDALIIGTIMIRVIEM